MSQFSAQDVQQLVSSSMKKYEQPKPPSVYNKTPVLTRRGNVRRRLVYPSQTMTLIRPDWNPSTINAPIYMSPPSLRSPQNNSLPRPQQSSEMQIYTVSNGTLPQHRDVYESPLYDPGQETLRLGREPYRSRQNPNPERSHPINQQYPARGAHQGYQKNSQSPNHRRSPNHRKYDRSRQKRSDNNIPTVRNTLYMTEYF